MKYFDPQTSKVCCSLVFCPPGSGQGSLWCLGQCQPCALCKAKPRRLNSNLSLPGSLDEGVFPGAGNQTNTSDILSPKYRLSKGAIFAAKDGRKDLTLEIKQLAQLNHLGFTGIKTEAVILPLVPLCPRVSTLLLKLGLLSQLFISPNRSSWCLCENLCQVSPRQFLLLATRNPE